MVGSDGSPLSKPEIIRLLKIRREAAFQKEAETNKGPSGYWQRLMRKEKARRCLNPRARKRR